MPVRSVHIKEYKGAAERWAHCYICFHPKPSREIPRRSSAAESAAGQGYLAVFIFSAQNPLRPCPEIDSVQFEYSIFRRLCQMDYFS